MIKKSLKLCQNFILRKFSKSALPKKTKTYNLLYFYFFCSFLHMHALVILARFRIHLYMFILFLKASYTSELVLGEQKINKVLILVFHQKH